MNFKKYFIITTGIACIIMALLLGFIIDFSLKDKIIENSLIESTNILKTRSALLQIVPESEDIRDVDRLFRMTGIENVVHIRTYSKKGDFLWSSPESLSISQIGDDPDITKALSGQPMTRILTGNEKNIIPFKIQSRHVAKIVTDVHSPTLIQEGVLVVYKDMDSIYADIRKFRYFLWILILGLFIIFFLVLYVGASRVSQDTINQAENLKKSADQLESSYRESLQILANAIESRMPYATGHSQRVALYATEIAKRMSLKQSEIEKVRFTCLLQNIGLVRIPDSILQKNGKLEAEELNKLRRHPVDGAELIRRSPTLKELANAVKSHHERYDGTGYPEGLVGEQIPLEARIVAAVDAYVAMTTKRPWREALPKEDALNEIRRHAGTQFDLKIVDMLIQVVREIPERRSGDDRRLSDWGPSEGKDRRAQKERRNI